MRVRVVARTPFDVSQRVALSVDGELDHNHGVGVGAGGI
jgi:hypothetical protein